MHLYVILVLIHLNLLILNIPLKVLMEQYTIVGLTSLAPIPGSSALTRCKVPIVSRGVEILMSCAFLTGCYRMSPLQGWQKENCRKTCLPLPVA